MSRKATHAEMCVCVAVEGCGEGLPLKHEQAGIVRAALGFLRAHLDVRALERVWKVVVGSGGLF